MAAHARTEEAVRLSAFGKTDTGLVREVNEDAFGMADLTTGQRWPGGQQASAWSAAGSGVLLEVSDGMGGAKAGEVASALSIEGVLTGMLEAAKAGHVSDKVLRSVIERVSKKIYEAGKRPDRRGMGATLTAILVKGRTAYVAQIGDSRAYLLRDGKLGQITHDQSYVQMLVDAGVMTPEEAERSPRKNIIMQVMGQESVKVALGRIELRAGDRLLLCSDGLTNVLDDSSICAVACGAKDLVTAVNELVAKTLEGGAPDNVTAILAEIG
jgi:serine/threonine protein phosphatase PrpC